MRGRRLRCDDGAVLVESAFVLPVFLLFVFGVIEFGLFFSASATTTSSTREGARFASANFGQVGGGQAAADAVRDVVVKDLDALVSQDTPVSLFVYKANANGYPDSRSDFADCTSSCFKYAWNAGTRTFDKVTGPVAWTNPDACITNTNPQLDSIGVYIQVRHQYVSGVFTGMLGSSTTLNEYTAVLLEPRPISQC